MMNLKRRKPLTPLQIVLLSVGVLAVVLVLLGLAAAAWVGGYLRSEDFRKTVEGHAGRALGAHVEIEPLRWQGASVFSGSAEARGLGTSPLDSLDARQLRARLDWRSALRGAARVESVDVFELDATFGSPAPKPPAPDVGSLPLPLPGGRVELGPIRIGRANLVWSARNLPARLTGAAMEITQSPAGWELVARGGSIHIEGIPDIALESARARLAAGRLYLSEAKGHLDGDGKLAASGKVGGESELQVTWAGVDSAQVLPEKWREKLRGTLAGEVISTWEAGGGGEIAGNARLTDGRLRDLPLLDQLAKFTGSPQFARMPLHEVSGRFKKVADAWDVQDFVLESKGLLRATGGFRIGAGGSLEGTFQVGVAPQVLQWIPGSREKVFTRNADGYVWTGMRLGGTLEDPREDLTARLALAAAQDAVERGSRLLRDSPDTIRKGAQGVLDAIAPILE